MTKLDERIEKAAEEYRQEIEESMRVDLAEAKRTCDMKPELDSLSCKFAFEAGASFVLSLLADRERAAFTAARMAFRTEGPMKEVPGYLLNLPEPNCYLYEDFDDYLSSNPNKGD